MTELYSETLEKISYWETWAQDTREYGYSLLKIWILFENFISKAFQIYSSGGNFGNEYAPNLKLQFQNEEHLNAFLCFGKNNQYIDYIKTVRLLSKHIFDDNKNPFAQITENDISFLDELQIIRNYIAHESSHAKKKYNDTFKDSCDDINIFLQKIKKNKQTYFSYYIKKVKVNIKYLYFPFF